MQTLVGLEHSRELQDEEKLQCLLEPGAALTKLITYQAIAHLDSIYTQSQTDDARLKVSMKHQLCLHVLAHRRYAFRSPRSQQPHFE